MTATNLDPLSDRIGVWNASETRIDEAEIDEIFKAAIEAGANITVTPNLTNGRLTIASTSAAPPSASETVQGIVELATDAEAQAGTDTSRALTPASGKALVDQEVSAIVDTAPVTLDTLNELAAALGDDPNFATTVSTQIGTKANASVTVTGDTGLAGGGDLSANRTITLDINGLTAESTVDSASDFLVLYDASASAHRKVLPQDMPGLGEINTGSSLGAGTAIFSAKVGVDLQFRSAVAGAGMSITSDATTLTAASTLGDGSRQLLTAL